ncbi:NAD(P)H-flavin reductase [Legionella sp. PC997]|uniref:NAD(P)H-flavin reductase n=1 Tax=Legionella sp. PC997 TaxID=2755562 RepID=UPI0015FA5063|nr:NAD(P)H-flavin reductase [Legionella sp. PC997]QMT58710.1 NAD(P)H-flavin reductase [Legionella sp. PC997]
MKVKTIKALVEDISPLTDSIMRLILAPEQYIAYQAGQYLQILFGEEAFSYSIANAPLGSHKYELHIRHSLENPYNQRLFAHIKQHGSVTIRLPLGECSIEHLHPQRPILFIAGGTGFAPVKAMIEQLLSTPDTRPFELFWGARLQNDLYMDEKVTSWQAHVSRFTYVSSVSEDNAVPLVSLVLANHPHDLGEWQIVISGPFDMVYSTRDALVNSGVSPSYLFSDAFSFEAK